MRIKFTDKTIQSLKPGDKLTTYYDKERTHGQGAFGIRITPTGKKTWYLSYKLTGHKLRMYRIGVYPEMSLKQARTEVLATITAIKAGNDPKDTKKREQEERIQKALDREQQKTMSDLWEAYVEVREIDKPKKPATLQEEDRKWSVMIEPVIGDYKVKDITHPIINKLLRGVAKRTPTNANRLYSLLRIMFIPALDAGWIAVHPMSTMKKPGGTEHSRQHVLTDDAIRTIWPKLDYLGSVGNVFKLLLLTAQRPGEILSMHWKDIDLKKKTWIQTETKNRSIHMLKLSPPVVEILQDIRDSNTLSNLHTTFCLDPGYVFPSPRKYLGHIKNINKARERLQEATGVTGFTNHDLRRTARTLMSRLRIEQHIRERVLNHAQGGIVGVYDQYDYLEEKGEALLLLGNEIARIVG